MIMKGAYLLNLVLKKDSKIIVGKLGLILFKKGFYCYCGSSQNNLEKRIARHKSREKKIHWHIDYLTTNPNFVVASSTKYENYPKAKECELSKELSKKYCSINGFGCSDCKCDSHLFFHKNLLKGSRLT
jgi:Uri superfamily endonuclease